MRAQKPIYILLLFVFSLCWLGGFSQGAGKAAYMQAENMRKTKRYNEAIEKYDEAIRQEPENYRYLFGRGKCYYQMKDFDLAIGSLEQTVEQKSDFTPAYSLLANCFLRKQDEANAIYYYDQAFKAESNPSRKVQYKMQVVKFYMKSQDYESAQSHISEAKAVAPEDLNILYYDAKLSNMNGDHENARNSMISAVSKLENAPPAKSAKFYYELGLAYNNLDDYENAKRAWEKANFGPYRKLIASQRAKNSPSFFYQKAISYYTAGQYEDSRGEIQRALELQSDFSPAFLLLGKMDKKQGNYTGAISNYESAMNMEEDPRKKAKLLYMLANLQLDAADYSGAVNSASQFLNMTPGDLNMMYIKATSQYYLGEYTGSIATIEEALSSSTIDNKYKAKFNFILGMSSKNTDIDRAREAFRSAMYGPFKPAAKNELDKLSGDEG